MKKKQNSQIDAVITWVDGGDIEWLTEKSKYNTSIDVDAAAERYRDYGTLKYVLRSIEKFSPWIRKIFLVTNGQVPNWLNLDSEKIELVKHSDYMPEEYLPTFSSHPIEWNFHKIEDLSENFIYFNDDMILTDYVESEDFFKDDLPCDTLGLGMIRPRELFSNIPFNNMLVLNKHFSLNSVYKTNLNKFINIKYFKKSLGNIILATRGTFYGMYDPHIVLAVKKSYFELLWEKEYELIHATCKNKFRNKNDVSWWLVRYWQLLEGRFVPRSIKFGKDFKIHSFVNDPKSEKILKKRKYKTICLNDSGNDNIDFNDEKEKLIKLMDIILPEKSSFEK